MEALPEATGVLDPRKILDIDLFSDDTKQNWFSLATDWARRPPFYVVNYGIPQVVVCRYEDVRSVFMAPDLFTSKQPEVASDRFDAFMGLTHVGTMDGPPHDRVRRILQPWFGTGGMARYEPDIARHVATLLDEIEEGGGEFDAVSQFSRLLIPRIMLGTMFGLSYERRQVLVRMNVELERVATAGGYPTSYVRAFEDARDVVNEVIKERTAEPTDDFIGGMVAGRLRDEPITDDEIVANVFAICVAAITTTSTTMAMTLYAWMRHRDEFEILRAEPELLPGAVDEALRLHPAGLFVFPRFAATDTELAGTKIPKDLPVHVCVAAANLDPEVYPDPLCFDIRRRPKHIMTFGAGPHYCAGGILARKIIQEGLRAFMERFPNLHLADPDFRPIYRGQLGEVAPESIMMRLR